MKSQYYMLVRKGMVQRIPVKWLGDDVLAWPVVETHSDAIRFAARTGIPGVRPALIGSVNGETLEGHIGLALEEGCRLVICIAGWNSDGSPKWKYIPFDDRS